MNLYIRYFDSEILVKNVEDAISFLEGIDEIGMNDKVANDIRAYYESDNRFPKRYKVRPKIYFIMIKTDANDMREFKDYRNRSLSKDNHVAETTDAPMAELKKVRVEAEQRREHLPAFGSFRERQANTVLAALHAKRYGWYEGVYDFKRVVIVPSTGKNEYRDTHFVVRCKAMSGMDCYNRMVEHLRDCVDSRSQFPSAKGRNFSFKYLGGCKPIESENN